MKKILLVLQFLSISFIISAQELQINSLDSTIETKINSITPQAVKNTVPFTGLSLVYIPDTKTSGAYNIGENVQSITDKRDVLSFYINAYETCYQLWYTTRLQAETEFGYTFQNPGQEGAGGRRGHTPTDKSKYQPVTTINWRDAIVWCNALSEIEGREPCYTYENTVLRDSTNASSIDLCVCNYKANGYRLPTETEWEYAARKTSVGFQRGDLVSGAVDSLGMSDNNAPEINYCWNETNSSRTANVGTTGSIFGAASEPGSGKANAMGLFDMSGNVLEFCNDWYEEYYSSALLADDTKSSEYYDGPKYGSSRVARGGSWSIFACYCYCGDRYAFDPDEAYNYTGFRFCTSSK
jgi:formylglycine-generating enzyme required for sulfatase activity